MRVGRIVMAILGGLLSLAGFGALIAGSALLAIHATQRDSAGFYQSPQQRLDTPASALLVRAEMTGLDENAWPQHPLGTVRITATSTVNTPLFVGVAPAAKVDTWLSGTAYARVTQLTWGPANSQLETVNGDRTASVPGEQDFWVASTSGTGSLNLTWLSERGDWALVIMNADGSSRVATDLSVGSDTNLLLPLGIISASAGVVLLGFGVAFLMFAVRRPGTQMVESQSVPGSYPVRLDGRLEPGLSRWLWLFKWFLAIPHFVVLALLWLAVFPLTVIAGFAILFTGRYPRSIFDFNVGVMRWTWRVSFYTFSALATDKYPPFSLEADSSYPANFTVDYPQHLSRGLVLVKWWLLAIPHYVIVALLTGAAIQFGLGGDRLWFSLGGGLIGILVLVAAIVLLFTGAYPAALFDLVMGFNRWCYRVLAYAGLMRDEYPPFRLDSGGLDPGSVPATPPPPPPPDGGELVGASSGSREAR